MSLELAPYVIDCESLTKYRMICDNTLGLPFFRWQRLLTVNVLFMHLQLTLIVLTVSVSSMCLALFFSLTVNPELYC